MPKLFGMKKTQLPQQDQRYILAQISNLDSALQKLTKWQEAQTFKSGSLMISGKTKEGKEFHEILVFDAMLQIPAYRLKLFVSYYLQKLVRYRQMLLDKLDDFNRNIATNNILDRAEFFCSTCVQMRSHHLHKTEMGLHWQCDHCSSINANAEID